MPAAKPRSNTRSSDDAVKAKTGKVWAEWFKILDMAGAKKLTHKEIWAYLNEKQKVGSWWSQMVAVEYEHARGLRDLHQKCTGEYSASVSRTMAVPIAKIYAAWVDDKVRNSWLGNAEIQISTKTENKSLRAAWDGGKSRLSVNFYPKGAAKTQVAVDHMKLANSKDCVSMKAYWSTSLNRLQELIEK
jgi:hypothetical protein